MAFAGFGNGGFQQYYPTLLHRCCCGFHSGQESKHDAVDELCVPRFTVDGVHEEVQCSQ